MRKFVADRAKKSGRSLNGELVMMLTEAIQGEAEDKIIERAALDGAKMATVQTLRALQQAKVLALTDDELKQVLRDSAKPVELFKDSNPGGDEK